MGIVIAVGGTGGHLYPAQVLAKDLIQDNPHLSILFMGGKLTKNKFFDQSHFAFIEVPCGTFSWRRPSLTQIARMTLGLWKSYRLLRQLKPKVVVGFGSYTCFPVLMAAKWLGIPYILHEQNAIPGQVNRFFSESAQFTALHLSEARKNLKGLCVEAAMPIRWKKDAKKRATAFSYFGLKDQGRTLLIFGGSQGAESLNRLIPLAVEKSGCLDLQIIHLTGHEQMSPSISTHWKNLGLPACVKPFENEMGLAWEIADLVISRSGAGTIAEMVEFEVPGILVPYPFSKDHHQQANAQFMAQEVKGGLSVQEGELSSPQFTMLLTSLLTTDKRKIMQSALQRYKIESNRPSLAELTLEFL